MIAIMSERNQILFLSDVLFAAASLNLKVPNSNTIKETDIASCGQGFIVGMIPMPYKDSTFFFQQSLRIHSYCGFYRRADDENQ